MLQNRVDPQGELIKTAARGTLMGNRGVIHDVNQNIVRPFKHKAWITCVLQFKDKHREVMTPNRWTELFFLDEATAFAAGHRPCCECRKENFKQFKLSWLKGNAQYGFGPKVAIKEIDNVIHGERIGKDRNKIIYEEEVQNLPDGTFVTQDGHFFLLANPLFPLHSWRGTRVRRADGFLYRWSPFGYAPGIPVPKTGILKVLTPKSIVNAFRTGYAPHFQLSSTAQTGSDL